MNNWLKAYWIQVALLLAIGMNLVACAKEPSQVVERETIDTKAIESGTTAASTIDSRGLDALLVAVGKGDAINVKALLEAGADPNSRGAARSPLLTAIMSRSDKRFVCNMAIVKALVEHGADVNGPDPNRDTSPLNQALAIGDEDCAFYLKNHGAHLNDLDPSGRSLMDSAVIGAVISGNLGIIDLPLKWGVSPNALSRVGTTALTTAVWLDSASAAKTLLARGVNPCISDVREADGIPLNLAVTLSRSRDLIELLKERSFACKR